jgi:peptidoglycan hydrolase-like protein with peptidoglycan-binding domain
MPVGIVEGYFGNLTKQTLVAYQKSVGLPATGYCGPMTRLAINAG